MPSPWPNPPPAQADRRHGAGRGLQRDPPAGHLFYRPITRLIENPWPLPRLNCAEPLPASKCWTLANAPHQIGDMDVITDTSAIDSRTIGAIDGVPHAVPLQPVKTRGIRCFWL